MSTQHTQSIETLVNVDTFTLTEILAFTIHLCCLKYSLVLMNSLRTLEIFLIETH